MAASEALVTDPLAPVLRLLRRRRIKLDAGLTDSEFRSVERRYNIRFPPDLRGFLAAAIPVGPGFPDWRRGHCRSQIWDGSFVTTALDEILTGPLEGILFDVERNEFWPPSWQPRPEPLGERKRAIERRVRSAPPLIPVYGHRYVPSAPNDAGNPVLSVHQTDIIYYGRDLQDYFRREFASGTEDPLPLDQIRRVPFWTDFVADCWEAR